VYYPFPAPPSNPILVTTNPNGIFFPNIVPHAADCSNHETELSRKIEDIVRDVMRSMQR